MIMIDRNLDQVIYLRPKQGIDLKTDMYQLFDYGEIGISIEDIGNNQVKIGLCLPDELEAVKKEEIALA